MTTTDRTALMAWLGPAADQLTAEQIDRLAREADIIAERYPGPDHRDEHDAALSAACQWLLGETDITRAGNKLARARAAQSRAFAVAQQVAAMAHADGMPEARAAEAAGVDRMTLRKYLGKR